MNDLNKNSGAEIIEMEQIILIHKDIRITNVNFLQISEFLLKQRKLILQLLDENFTIYIFCFTLKKDFFLLPKS